MKIRSHYTRRVSTVRLVRIPFLHDRTSEVLHAAGEGFDIVEATAAERRALRRAWFRFRDVRGAARAAGS